jgi:hypothetical protein
VEVHLHLLLLADLVCLGRQCVDSVSSRLVWRGLLSCAALRFTPALLAASPLELLAWFAAAMSWY